MAKLDAAARRGKSPEVAFGRVLSQWRKRRSMSQKELAFASGYHRTYIGQLERGEKSPSLRTIFDLSNTLKVKPSELVRRTELLFQRQTSR